MTLRCRSNKINFWQKFSKCKFLHVHLKKFPAFKYQLAFRITLLDCFWAYFQISNFGKQPSKGVPRKRSSENMQQIYWRTPMPKCDFNKVAYQLYWNRSSAWVFSGKFAAYFAEHLFLGTDLDGCFWQYLSCSMILILLFLFCNHYNSILKLL